MSEKIEDEEFFDFAIDNLSASIYKFGDEPIYSGLSEMFEYIAQGNLNIRIHRDVTGVWFGVG